jgi:hypothetical protein
MKIKQFIPTFFILPFISCQPDNQSINEKEFALLMNRLAGAWTNQHTDLAVGCFDKEAIYMQPPDQQLYQGHEQLRPFFAALKKGNFTIFGLTVRNNLELVNLLLGTSNLKRV